MTKNNLLLLINPEEYARRAIVSLENQLTTAIGENRIAKLNRKLTQWQTTLTVLTEEKKNAQENKTESTDQPESKSND